MAFLDELRKRFRQSPGYAGGTLEDQLGQDQMLTPQNREAITRPRTVTQPNDVVPTGSMPSFKDLVRQRRTQPRDQIADDAQYLQDLENEPRTWKDKVVDVLDVTNAAFGGKPRTLQTPRERNIKTTQDRLARELSIGQKQSQMKGVESQMAAREAAVLSGQERIRQADERLQQGETRIQQQQKQLLAGVLNRRDEFNPDDPANLELVNALHQAGLPVVPKKRGQQLKWVQNAATGQWEILAGDKTSGTSTSSTVITPEGSPLVTTSETSLNRDAANQRNTINEAGRNRRATVAETGRAERAAGIDRRADGRGTPKPSAAQTKQANALAARYNLARKAEMSTSIAAKEKPGLQAQREVLWTQIMDTYPGMFEADGNGELRPKAGEVQRSGRTIDGAIQAFTKKVGRAPTAEETAKMKVALGQ